VNNIQQYRVNTRSTQIRDISDTSLYSMSEDEFARWQRESGEHVIYHRDRYWKQTVPGFYQPLHWMARLKNEQATRPTPLCWGFQATLREEDAAHANGAIPIHLLTDLEGYGLQSLPSKRRTHLRKCYRLVKFVELLSPSLLQEQGYEVVCSALSRTVHTKLPTKEQYLSSLNNYVVPERRIVLAGLINDKLAGYLTGYAINETAYMEDAMLTTEALSTNIGTGLRFEFVQICRRSEQIRQVVSGLHAREDRSLCTFKENMGFSVHAIPAKVQINPIAKQLLQWRYPDKYYRLTGQG